MLQNPKIWDFPAHAMMWWCGASMKRAVALCQNLRIKHILHQSAHDITCLLDNIAPQARTTWFQLPIFPVCPSSLKVRYLPCPAMLCMQMLSCFTMPCPFMSHYMSLLYPSSRSIWFSQSRSLLAMAPLSSELPLDEPILDKPVVATDLNFAN